MGVCVDLVAENVKTALSDSNTHGIGERLAGTHPVGTKTIHRLALGLGAQLQDVQWEHVEASIRYWLIQADLVERLNCPHCNVQTQTTTAGTTVLNQPWLWHGGNTTHC